jgi:hypothetical protein
MPVQDRYNFRPKNRMHLTNGNHGVLAAQQERLTHAESCLVMTSQIAGAIPVQRPAGHAYRVAQATISNRRFEMQSSEYEWISKRAYTLWEAEGHPNGRDAEHWGQATREFKLLNESTATHPAVKRKTTAKAAAPAKPKKIKVPAE